MLRAVHRGLLKVYRRLPTHPRRWVVRTIAPSFTVGSMVVIERSDGAILFVRQVYRSRWGVPGGLLKRGEEASDAAHREVREEVGVDIKLIGAPAVVIDPEPQRVDVVYRARVLGEADRDLDAVVPCSPEIEEVGWFHPRELPELQFETSGALVELARVTRDASRRPVHIEDVSAIFRDRPAG